MKPAFNLKPLATIRYGLGIIAACFLMLNDAHAADTYQSGHISRVSYSSNVVLIRIDNVLPTNCSGTASGWMMIAAPYTGMIAFVTGLWFSGNAASTQVVVYTSPVDGSGFCQVTQIDTLSAG